MNPAVYVAGPVTGIQDLNRKSFERARYQLEQLGLNVVIPHDHVPADASWSEAMAICLPLMSLCDAVVLLDGWEDSHGARMECVEASRLGIPCYMLRELVQRRDGMPSDFRYLQVACGNFW